MLSFYYRELFLLAAPVQPEDRIANFLEQFQTEMLELGWNWVIIAQR